MKIHKAHLNTGDTSLVCCDNSWIARPPKGFTITLTVRTNFRVSYSCFEDELETDR